MGPWRTQGTSWGGEGAPDLANSEPDVRNLSVSAVAVQGSCTHGFTCEHVVSQEDIVEDLISREVQL
jgi:hypothetical protein